ncbi:allantoate amidohydrolase [Amycolatopsis cihanbeyliensis]|uniref:N-carbamoyl-L-amino-acid hydrolase n=1 Tax=Amycolatopsis cihanbeyliensis TaxID=1128664 RepID=A0A542DQ12_AMYCI|nr:allantoate amidohydrolase [Amycolatopsis cihanbeyliensis]TQJ05182.1 N-carbamoyl-L-amino-acid hydrolase [Amycolatopsis cihanbeyliensis]
MSTQGLLDQIADVGRDRRRGGYSRHAFDPAERELRTWFTEQASRRGLDVETDRNGNLWAWWGNPGPDALVTGSHLDSVPGGGAFDGPLGVVSAFTAVDALRERGRPPRAPFAVVAFAEEEGGRFGVPCLGSRLLTGAIGADAARALTDPNGVTLAEAAAGAGLDPERLGPDPDRLAGIGRFVELHVEQGKGLGYENRPLAIGTDISAHGRWRFTFTGQGDHAGTTLLMHRKDPMLPAAATIGATRIAAMDASHGRATVGRLVPNPGGTNVIASTVDLWLDARAEDEYCTRAMVEEITEAARSAAEQEGCTVQVTEESYSDTVYFDRELRHEFGRVLGKVPAIPTGAGHDAGILAAHVPTGMLFVRNPTGISHAPEEFAEPEDVEQGAAALADVLEHLGS